MRCVDCEHFEIICDPVKTKVPRAIWELGQCICKKHKLVNEWLSKRTINRLTCVEDKEGSGT